VTCGCRRRIELVQDLEVPAACNRLKLTPDGQYLFASGTHAPRVRPRRRPAARARLPAARVRRARCVAALDAHAWRLHLACCGTRASRVRGAAAAAEPSRGAPAQCRAEDARAIAACCEPVLSQNLTTRGGCGARAGPRVRAEPALAQVRAPLRRGDCGVPGVAGAAAPPLSPPLFVARHPSALTAAGRQAVLCVCVKGLAPLHHLDCGCL